MSAQVTKRDARKAAILPAVGGSLLGLGVFLATLIGTDEREVTTRSWAVSAATGGSLLFLGALLVTLAVPSPGAGERPGVHRDPLITAASILFYFSGFASVASFLPSMLYISRTGELPEFRGIRFMGNALFEQLWGVRGVMISLVPFAVLGAFEILAGTWLWRSSEIGGALGLWLTPFAVVFLLGYGAPYLFVVVPLRAILVALAWSSLT